MSEIAVPTTGEIEALNAGDLRGSTPGGLPYPETTGPLNQGANDIKALALAVDALVGAWVQVPLSAGFTGSCLCRQDGAGNVQMAGQVSGTFGASATICTLPVGYRPVFPAGSGLTYFVYTLAANASGNAGTLSVRAWGNGAIVVVGVNGTFTNADVASIRFSTRNG